MSDGPKILKPGQLEVSLQPQEIPYGGTLQVQLRTPEGRMLMVLVQVKDWNLEKDTFLLAVGQVDLTEAAKAGNIMSVPKGLIS